jgi:hypothetical protein
MKYLQLFSLEIQHDYYTDRRCPDFQIDMTPDTRRLLANYRCVVKPFPNGIRVLIQASEQTPDQNTPFIPMPVDVSFGFQLRLQNPALLLFTDLHAMTQLAAPWYVGKGTGGVLGLVSHPPDAPLAQGVFADVGITIGNAMAGLTASSNAFVLQFSAKKCRWKYYLITSKTLDASIAPAIEDKDKAVMFDATGLTDLTASPDPADQIGCQLAMQYPGLQLFRLISTTLIPCQEAVRKTLQLQINGEKVINALPNPSIRNYVIDTKVSVNEDGLFHTLKYFNQ